MLEIEAKYPLAGPAAFAVRLQNWGARLVEQRSDADHYFNAPDRDFAVTDEAFRVRRIGARTFLTWKGPKLDRETKTRQEIEVPVADGEQAATDLIQLVQKLGYRPVAVVQKRRQVYEVERDGFSLHFCIDDVEQVGSFAEIEIVAEPEKLDSARALLLRVAQELGLTQSERRSYLQLLLQARGQA
jgi:adenylate cyclase, class 2